jgi:uncharacterized peroxidase-related enzyme
MNTIFRDELVVQRVTDLHRQAAKQRLLRELRASRTPTVHRRRIWEWLTAADKHEEIAMTFIETATEGAAAGTAAQLYAEDVAAQGYVANYTRVFALRPEVLAGWAQLNRAIKRGMDLRRYELATLAAARALRSTYCAMAHGRALRDRFYDPETVRRIATDHTRAGLTPAEVAVIDFADQVTRDATSIGSDDIQRLRAHGLSDTDILDVALAAAARCFFSTVLDAMGAQADGALSDDLQPPLRAALTVGRAPQPSDRPTALPAAPEAS